MYLVSSSLVCTNHHNLLFHLIPFLFQRGCREVMVFRRQGDSVEIGRLTNEPELPDRGNWGINSTSQDFDPELRTFQIQYDLKASEELGLVETVGLEWFTFEVLDEESI